MKFSSPQSAHLSRSALRPVIMQVIPELSSGGAEQGCIDVAAAIVKSGGTAIVVSNGGSRVQELRRAGAIHIDLPVHSKNPLTMRRNAKRLKKIIKKQNVHIVHARSRAPAWSAYWACQKTNAHFMTTFHAPYKITNEWKLKYNSVMARGELIIAISDMVANYIVENYNVQSEYIRVIPRGIAMNRFHPTTVSPMRLVELAQEWRIPDGANIVLLPGRITRLKGHHVLIDAMARLKRKDLFCVMLGSDQGRVEYRKELEDAIESKGMAGRIRIINECHDMPAAYMMASVVVSASTEPEGFGRVPVEAQAMGRPVIGTNHGGVRETIRHGETGWLVEPNDAIALSRALHDVLALSEEDRAMLATLAMSHVADHFTLKQMITRTLDVYKELLVVRS